MFGIAFLIAVSAGAEPAAEITGEAELFAPGIAPTDYSEIRLTISPDGKTALWFRRDRPGRARCYDTWMARRVTTGWSSPPRVRTERRRGGTECGESRRSRGPTLQIK